MRRIVHDLGAASRQWPAIVAESLGLKSPPAMLPAPERLPERERWTSSRFGAAWLGHATALLRLGDVTIMTDPALEERVGVSLGPVRIGRRRSVALPENVDDMPPIDIVMLSHAHLDHWDRASLGRLASKHTIAVIPAKTRRLLPRGFGHVIELGADKDVELDGLHITALRPNHWGARYLVDRHRGCNAYLIEPEGEEHNRTLFVGDTAHTESFDVLSDRHPMSAERFPRSGVDLAIIGIGGYYLEHHHATPEQVAAMARRMNATRLLPIHHGTFRGAREPIDEPLARLSAAWEPERIVCARVGEAWFGDER